MTSKIITYDLRIPNRNYDDLYKAIKSYVIWARVTESTWFVKTSDTCSQIRDKLLANIDQNDRLFVGELSGNAAWHNTICESDFVKKNI